MKNKKKPTTAQVVDKHSLKIRTYYHEMLKELDEQPIRMSSGVVIGRKYDQLIMDFATLCDRFSELQRLMKFNKKGE